IVGAGLGSGGWLERLHQPAATVVRNCRATAICGADQEGHPRSAAGGVGSPLVADAVEVDDPLAVTIPADFGRSVGGPVPADAGLSGGNLDECHAQRSSDWSLLGHSNRRSIWAPIIPNSRSIRQASSSSLFGASGRSPKS